MLDINLLLAAIGSPAVKTRICQSELPASCTKAVLFNPLVSCTPDCIYVTEAEVLSLCRDLPDLRGITLFVSSQNQQADWSAALLPDCNLIFCELPLFSLHQELCRAMAYYTGIVRTIMQSSHGDAEALLRQASRLLGVSLRFTDMQYRPLAISCGAGCPEGFPFEGAYTEAACRRLFPDFLPCDQPLVYKGPPMCATAALHYGDMPIGYLFAAGDSESELLAQHTLLCSRMLTELLRGNVVYTTRHGIVMNDLIRRLCSREVMSDADFRRQLSLLKNPAYKFCKIAVIRFENIDSISPQRAFADAIRIFHSDNLTWYNEQIFVLISSPKFYCASAADESQVADFLQQYDAYMMISNTLQNARGLQQLCLQVLRSIRMAWCIHQGLSDGRIMLFRDYAIYHIIDLAIQEYQRCYGLDDPMFLCHPAIVVLMRYDRATDSRLCEFLLYYLGNNLNIAKTAAHFFMHRNTAVYQRDKIARMIRYQFDDPEENLRLVYSLYLSNYRKYYQKLPLHADGFDKSEY